MILETGHDKNLDIWSLGVLIFELLTGKAPFAPGNELKDQKDKQRVLEENVVNIRISFPNDFPQYAKDLLSKILRKIPTQRLALEEIKLHPWLKLNNNTSLNTKAINANANEGSASPNQKVNSTKLIKIQAKDLEVLNDPEGEGFDAEQILDLANKKGSMAIMNSEKIAGNINGDSEGDKGNKKDNTDLFNYSNNADDLKQKTIEELSDKLKQLMQRNNELEVTLKKKTIDYDSLNSELERMRNYESNESTGTIDLRKYRILEEEKKNLKKEFDHIWENLKEKENTIQRQAQELKKHEDSKKNIEKHKSEKLIHQEKIRKYQEEISNLELKYNQLKTEKEEDKLQYEMALKHRIITGENNEDGLIGGMSQATIIKEIGRILEDVKEKIEAYKENMEEDQRKVNRLQELERELNRLKSNRDIEVNELQNKWNEAHEEEIEAIKRQNKKKIDDLEEKLQKQKEEYEGLIGGLKKENLDRGFKEVEYESLKKQLELSNGALVDVKQDWETMKKLKGHLDLEIKEQGGKLREMEDLIKKLNKK